MRFSARRAPSRLLRSLALAVLALSVLATSAEAGGVTTGSILKLASAAVAKQPSAHVESIASNKTSKSLEKIEADVGSTSGSESVTEGKAEIKVRVTPTAAYISGNSSGLTTLFGFTAAEVKSLGTNWESWAAGTNQYANLKSDVTVPAVRALLPKAKGTKLMTAKTHYLLSWTTAAAGSVPKLANTLSISTDGRNLPVQEIATSASGVKVSTKISRWGENILVAAPPASTVVASSTIAG